MKAYFTLAVQHEIDEPWSVEFGSFEGEEVMFEAETYIDNCNDLFIFMTDGSQGAIDSMIAELNVY
jgi:hypothetical protein